MKPQNFLSFNEKTIYFKEVGNEYWIAIKPICEALDINYNRAYQNILDDENLSQLFAKQQTRLCLFVPIWLIKNSLQIIRRLFLFKRGKVFLQ